MGSLVIAPVAAGIGAEISGVDLAAELSDEEFEAIHRALVERMVLFFRGQQLSPPELVRLARRLGEIYYYPAFPTHPAHPEIQVLGHSSYNNIWHRDSTHIARPPEFTLLYCLSTPRVGGDTVWSNMQAAYERLAPPLQRLVDELSAIHDFTRAHIYMLEEPGGVDKLSRLAAEHPAVIHPLVLEHPVTGKKALYVDRGYTFAITDMPLEQSDPLLELLKRHAERVDFQARLRWSANTLAIWDNRSTIHYGPVMDYPYVKTERERRMHRITVHAGPGR